MYLCAVESILFVENEQCLFFARILELLDISSFDFWKLVNSFIVFDPHMPSVLKRHFRDIELKIVSQLGWKKGSPLINIISDLEKRSKKKFETESLKSESMSTPGSGE